MHELTRLAYLEAMGVDSYVSRRSLGGAAPTRRLAVIRDSAVVGSLAQPAEQSVLQTPAGMLTPDFDLDSPRVRGPKASSSRAAPAATPKAQKGPVTERFSLAAVVAGGCLWLEDLAGMPISKEQVWLMNAMAQALGLSHARRRGVQPDASLSNKPDVAQFDWPIHTNDQFDLGEEAAQASVAGFVSRRLDQFQCRAVVLLGGDCDRRLQAQQIAVPMVRTSSTAQMLAEPSIKAIVWRDLTPLLQG